MEKETLYHQININNLWWHISATKDKHQIYALMCYLKIPITTKWDKESTVNSSDEYFLGKNYI